MSLVGISSLLVAVTRVYATPSLASCSSRDYRCWCQCRVACPGRGLCQVYRLDGISPNFYGVMQPSVSTSLEYS